MYVSLQPSRKLRGLGRFGDVCSLDMYGNRVCGPSVPGLQVPLSTSAGTAIPYTPRPVITYPQYPVTVPVSGTIAYPTTALPAAPAASSTTDFFSTQYGPLTGLEWLLVTGGAYLLFFRRGR